MVRITKVYTRTGDNGETGLVGGTRLLKDHPRIEGFGTVDELNSCLGLVRSFNTQKPQSERRDKLEVILQAIQQKLFDMGSELATLPGDEYPGQIKLDEADASWLEEVIDAMNTELGSLKSFILPGGTPLNAFLHQSRTTCRRAERAVLRLHRVEPVNPAILQYLNRLSDALFVFGRWVTAKLDETELLWQPGSTRPDWRWSTNG